MRTQRVWIEILFLSTAVACVVALFILPLGAAAGANSGARVAGNDAPRQENPSATERTYEGVVSCSRCGARHSAALGQTAADCVRTCVRDGANFVLVDSDTTYRLDGDISVLARLAGQRARIVGELDGKTLRIASIVPENLASASLNYVHKVKNPSIQEAPYCPLGNCFI